MAAPGRRLGRQRVVPEIAGQRSALSASSPIRYVQIDGLVLLKILKHCEDAGENSELLQGVLVGLVVDDRLEVTNCFPFPRHTDDEEFDEMTYQLDMMRNLRQVNVDHLHVGWYQSTFYGAFLNRALLESQFQYQQQIEESVVLIYDPQKTKQGFLALTAKRLTKTAMDLCLEGSFTAERLRDAKLSYAQLFEEIPLVIKNSHLINALCCQVEDEDENQARKNADGDPLPDEDINKVFKPLPPYPRQDAMLTAAQIANYCTELDKFCCQSLGKMYITGSLQTDAATKTT